MLLPSNKQLNFVVAQALPLPLLQLQLQLQSPRTTTSAFHSHTHTDAQIWWMYVCVCACENSPDEKSQFAEATLVSIFGQPFGRLFASQSFSSQLIFEISCVVDLRAYLLYFWIFFARQRRDSTTSETHTRTPQYTRATTPRNKKETRPCSVYTRELNLGRHSGAVDGAGWLRRCNHSRGLIMPRHWQLVIKGKSDFLYSHNENKLRDLASTRPTQSTILLSVTIYTKLIFSQGNFSMQLYFLVFFDWSLYCCEREGNNTSRLHATVPCPWFSLIG